MKTAFSFLKSLMLNVAYLALAWFAYARESAGARNLFVFSVWFFFACSTFIFVAICKEEFRKQLCGKKRNIPAWLSVAFDAVLVVMLAWYGQFLMGALTILANWMASVLFRPVEEDAKP